ncbi:DUF1538 domain-containing protein [Methanoculleus frigidifontis]|nr:DUF1538 domain-containing protein [Methanoculleus sp. FWC-SCC1]
MREVALLAGIDHVMINVAAALLPLLVFFIIFQVTHLKLPTEYVTGLLKGVLLAFVGMVLFLQGVEVAFLPAGQAIGAYLGSLEQKWVIILFGFLLGFLATYAEPAVRVLCYQIEQSSAGSIRSSLILYTLSTGVAIAVALGMARIVYDLPFLAIIVVGYLLAIALLRYADRDFIAIAFDSGGVATGPMAVTFLTALAVGAAASIGGRTTIADSFGLVALIALAPILAVLLLSTLYRKKRCIA